MTMPFRRHNLGFKCPGCGCQNGSLRRKIIKLSQETLTEKNMPAKKVKRYILGDRLLREEAVLLKIMHMCTNLTLFLG